VLQSRIHHDDDATGGQASPGFDTPVEFAVRFDEDVLRPVDCGYLGGVRFYWWPVVPAAFSVKVYGAGTPTSPGALLYEQAVATFLPWDWNVVTLDAPVDLAGGDLWVALAYTPPGPGHTCIGLDAGPRVAGVNFLFFEGAWAESTYEANFSIQALVYH
jgi:hypothetical protein